MNPDPRFPRLAPGDHRDTSPPSGVYNCIAWAAGDSARWWQPGHYWPVPGVPVDDNGIGSLEAAFRSLGYADCGLDAAPEPGFAKVALYAAGASSGRTRRGNSRPASGRASWGSGSTSSTTPPRRSPAACTARSTKS